MLGINRTTKADTIVMRKEKNSMITMIDVQENTRYVHINDDIYNLYTGKYTVPINKVRSIKR